MAYTTSDHGYIYPLASIFFMFSTVAALEYLAVSTMVLLAIGVVSMEPRPSAGGSLLARISALFELMLKVCIDYVSDLSVWAAAGELCRRWRAMP